MSNYNLKINLLKLKWASIQNITGKSKTVPCLVIPITDNPELYYSVHEGVPSLSFNGTVYELKQASTYGDTHLIKPSLNKEAYEQLTEEERKKILIVGNLKPYKTESQTPSVTTTASIEGNEANGLPF